MGKNTILRRLSNEATLIFSNHIQNKINESVSQLPFEMELDEKYSTPIDSPLEIDLERQFSDRFEFGEYITSIFGGSVPSNLINDSGFWNWLSLAYFDQFCPKKKPNRQEHYILSIGQWKQPGSTVNLTYRHCAKTPTELVSRFGDKAKFFLKGRPMTQMGDIVEQICSKDRIMKSNSIIETLFTLYADPKTGHPRTGCSSYTAKPKKLKNGKWSKSGYGGIRRLVDDTLPQIRLTYNVDIMKPQDVLSTAGPEFKS